MSNIILGTIFWTLKTRLKEMGWRYMTINRAMMSHEKALPVLAWFMWILIGTCFYGFHEHLSAAVAMYKSTSVGWAIGWSLPYTTSNMDDSTSMIFSCFHNSIGVMFQGLAVIYIAEALSDSKDNWTVEITRKMVIEQEIDNSKWSMAQAWLKLNATKFKVICWCVGCFVFGVFGGVSFDEWTILKSMDMTLSTLTCSGYLGLPPSAASWKLIVLSIYTNIGVPLLAISLGALISIFMESPDEKSFYSRVAAKLTPQEIEFMNTFEIDDGTGLLSLGEFIILMTVRMGSLAPSVVTKLNQYFKLLDTKNEGRINYAELVADRRVSKLLALPGMIPPDINEVMSADMLMTSQLIQERSNSNAGRQTTADKASPIVAPYPNVQRRPTALANRRASITARRASVSAGRPQMPGRFPPTAVVPFVPATIPGTTMKPEDKTSPPLRVIRSASNVEEFVEEGRAGDVAPVIDPSERSVVKTCTTRSVAVAESWKPEEVKRDDDISVSEWLRSTPIRDLSGYSSDSEGYIEMDQMFAEIHARAAERLAQRSSSGNSSTSSSDTDGQGDVIGDFEKVLSGNDEISHDNHVRSPTAVEPVSIVESCSSGKHAAQRDSSRGKHIIMKQLSEDTETSSASSSVRERKRENSMISKSTSRRSGSLRKMGSIRSSGSKSLRNRDVSEKIKKAGEILDRIESSANEENLLRRILMYSYYILQDNYVQILIAWACWLFLGAFFYAAKMSISFYKAFYYSVNVGYSVFWTSFEMDGPEKVFTVFHLISGQVLMSFAMAAFARHLIAAKDIWYVEKMKEAEMANAASKGFWKQVLASIGYYGWKYRAFFLFGVWLCFGIMWSVGNIKWSIVQGFYFSITAMSTGGIWSIPDDSPDSFFFVVAVYTCTGAPIMLLSFGSLAHSISDIGQEKTLANKIQAPITQEEILIMYELDIEDGDGSMDRCEYIILMIIRLKAMRIELIDAIADRFCDLDSDGDGLVSYEDIQGEQGLPGNIDT